MLLLFAVVEVTKMSTDSFHIVCSTMEPPHNFGTFPHG